MKRIEINQYQDITENSITEQNRTHTTFDIITPYAVESQQLGYCPAKISTFLQKVLRQYLNLRKKNRMKNITQLD